MNSSRQLLKNPNAPGYVLDLKMTGLGTLTSALVSVQPGDVSELILAYNSLRFLEEPLLQFRNLRALNVSVNQIKEITNLSNCRKLESLNLSTNRISRINGLESLTALTRLDLSMNYIEKIEGLTLFSLKVLNLSNNNLRRLENLEALVNLESIDVSKNKLTELGCFETTMFRRLTRLVCKHNLISGLYVEEFKSVLGNLPVIEEIDFIGNEVSQSPEFPRVISQHATPSLKIVNGGPAFVQAANEKKPNDRQRSVVTLTPTHVTQKIDMPAMKVTSMRNIIQTPSDERSLIEQTKNNTEDFMRMVANHSMVRSSEKFRYNQEYLAKLKQGMSQEISGSGLFQQQQQPVVMSQSGPQYQKFPSQIIQGSSNINISPRNTKRPSAFSMMNNEERKQEPFTLMKQSSLERGLPPDSNENNNKKQQRTSEPQAALKKKPSTIDQIPKTETIIEKVPLISSDSPVVNRVHKRPPNPQSKSYVFKGQSLGIIEPMRSLPSEQNSKESSRKEMGSLEHSGNSKSKDNSQHLSDDDRDRRKRHLTIVTDSLNNQRKQKPSKPRTINLTEVSQTSSNEVTEKLKERFEKFKENSRRNSDIVKFNKKNVDWKEKRMEFLKKKQEKSEEEKRLVKTLKRGPINSEDKKEVKSQMCCIF